MLTKLLNEPERDTRGPGDTTARKDAALIAKLRRAMTS